MVIKILASDYGFLPSLIAF